MKDDFKERVNDEWCINILKEEWKKAETSRNYNLIFANMEETFQYRRK